MMQPRSLDGESVESLPESPSSGALAKGDTIDVENAAVAIAEPPAVWALVARALDQQDGEADDLALEHDDRDPHRLGVASPRRLGVARLYSRICTSLRGPSVPARMDRSSPSAIISNVQPRSLETQLQRRSAR